MARSMLSLQCVLPYGTNHSPRLPTVASMPDPEMQTYQVVERWANETRFALRCGRGKFHVTRALNNLPTTGATLHGARPELGLGILVCPVSGAIFRVIFESINQIDPFHPNDSRRPDPHLREANRHVL